jgi:ABC-type iron transport system FetAB ATPase subunit
MQQLEIGVLYNLQCESAASMFYLRDVVTYIAKRIGLIPGRVWFESGNRINVKMTAQQRRNFLRFLNRHELKQFLVFDDSTRFSGGESAKF